MPLPDLSVFYLLHQGLRNEFGALARAAKATQSDVQKSLIEEQLGMCLDMLERHETLESNWLFPTIRNRAPEASPGIEALSLEHDEIVAYIASCRSQSEKLEARAPIIGELDAILGPHLAREERDLVPFIVNYITADEWDGFSYQTLNSVPEAQLPIVLGWLMTSGTEEQVRSAKALLPTDVRMRLRFRWLPRYRARLRRLY